MTHVYKQLPDGGYTAMPVRSEVDTARRLREGWSLTPPADTRPTLTVNPITEEIAEAVSAVEDAAPDAPETPRRGRKGRDRA